MLKFEVDQVPGELENYYEATPTGKFRLKVEGVVPASQFEEQKTKLSEFRNSNVDLKKRVDALAQFEQMFQSGDFSSDKLQGKVESIVGERTAAMRTAHDTVLKDLTKQLETERGRLANIVLSEAVKTAALKHGVHEGALDDVLARAKSVFKVEEGKLVPASSNLDEKGNAPTLDGWLEGLGSSATHLFNSSRGAGATKVGRPIQQVPNMSAADKISAGLASRKRK